MLIKYKFDSLYRGRRFGSLLVWNIEICVNHNASLLSKLLFDFLQFL